MNFSGWPLRVGSIIILLFFSISVEANNLAIKNVSLSDRNPQSKTVAVNFDISWDNSWRNKINHDALWLTVRLLSLNNDSNQKKLCTLSVDGLNPKGTSPGASNLLEIFVPQDKVGAFVRRKDNSSPANISSQNIQLTINTISCGMGDEDQIQASIFALEMVWIPVGSFYAGDNAASSAAFTQGSGDSDPWLIQSEDALTVTNDSQNGYFYTSAGNANEDPTGTSFTLFKQFPKGFNGFYVMKYEINEQQWVDFVNSLPSAARVNHDLTDNNHKKSDTVTFRNSVSCSGTPLVCATERPFRAVSYLSWMDTAAFLDWSGLRPMTELEFEKMARGPLVPLKGEFAWGSTDIKPAEELSQILENGTESVLNITANAHYNAVVLSGGDTSNGDDHTQGPLRNGIFAKENSNRMNAGAGYYGVMELSGNCAERVVTLGNAAGRLFQGKQGDGNLSVAAGFEGYANESGWPGLDSIQERGVIHAQGTGLRGGSWQDTLDFLRISDRSEAALETEEALPTFGGRGVRSNDTN